MNLSRLNETAPSPPLPAETSILASSMNFIGGSKQKSPIGRMFLYDVFRNYNHHNNHKDLSYKTHKYY
jgi:hypothetical protein